MLISGVESGTTHYFSTPFWVFSFDLIILKVKNARSGVCHTSLSSTPPISHNLRSTPLWGTRLVLG